MAGTMTWKEAHAWAKQDVDNRDWRDQWKYGDVVRGMGLGDGILIDWGPSATAQQKALIQDGIQGLSRWAAQVENILDSPPSATTRTVMSEMDRIKGVAKRDAPARIEPTEL